MIKFHNPESIAPPVGNRYTHGVEVPAGARVLHVSGQVGIEPDGTIPDGIEGQAHAAWKNVITILEAGGMGVGDIVNLNHWLVEPTDFPTYSQVRAQYLGDIRPASTLMIVKALVMPELVVEVGATAAKV